MTINTHVHALNVRPQPVHASNKFSFSSKAEYKGEQLTQEKQTPLIISESHRLTY